MREQAFLFLLVLLGVAIGTLIVLPEATKLVLSVTALTTLPDLSVVLP